MNQKLLQLNALLSVALLFNLLFWQEKMGLNVLLFDLALGFCVWQLYPKARHEKPVLYTGIGTLLMALLVVWNNTHFAKVIHLLSLLSFVGFVQVRSMAFIGTAFGVGLTSVLEGPLKSILALGDALKLVKENNTPLLAYGRWVQLSVIPLVVASIFYGMYALANPAFARLSEQFWGKIGLWLIPDIDVYRLLFFLLSLLIAIVILWPSHVFRNFREAIRRHVLKRAKSTKRVRYFKSLDLKMEYRAALLLMGTLNLLLFVVNGLDIWHIWLGNSSIAHDQLSQYVHEGTWLLITAIILGMIVLGYHFRKNLNFYPGNRLLKKAAFLWIAQNGVLTLSVGMRNFRYIEHYGLAYKRLGVILFLIMVLIGLMTMYVKVRRPKTFYYLLYHNAWACYALLLLAASINWDVAITRYNLNANTSAPIDLQYLIDDLSDKNIFVLYQHFQHFPENTTWQQRFQNHLKVKTERFTTKQLQYSWLSWNYADHRNRKFIKKHRE